MHKKWKDQSGFTLVEMLIVVIVLGILAMIVVPQVAVSTEDTKLKTLQTNLSALRNAAELYYAQHNQTYPGAKDNAGAANPTALASATAFVEQLTQYTDINGAVQTTKDNTYKYGPYIKGGALPTNPFDIDSDVLCDILTADITTKAADGTTSWKFYVKTGILLPNDNGTTDGTVHASL
ncbi:MAG: type II secretion system protein [Desulfobacterales bacterium]|nr:type II secretion system protein [Desulfobacterales bacterium]